MKSGQMTERVLFQRRLTTQNDLGEVLIEFVDAFYDMAAVEPLAGRELFQAQQTQAEIDTRIRLRWRRGISELMRVIHTTSFDSPQLYDVYDVVAVLPLRGIHHELQLMCTRRATEQLAAPRAQITADMDNVTADNG